MEGGYGFLLDLALILLSTKLLGLLTQRFQLPQVVGALLAGLILGPAVLNVIQETEFIKDTAEIACHCDDVLRRHGNRCKRAEAQRQGGLYHCPHRRAGAHWRRLCPGLFLQPARGHRIGRHHPCVPAKHVHRRYPHRHLGEHLRGDAEGAGQAENPLGQRHFGRGYHR